MTARDAHGRFIKAAEQVVAMEPVPVGNHNAAALTKTVEVQPTQVRRPWRSTLRTVFQAGLALAAMWAIIVQAAGLPDWAWVGTSLAVAAGITRVMALPGVEVLLRTYLPFLAAAPKS